MEAVFCINCKHCLKSEFEATNSRPMKNSRCTKYVSPDFTNLLTGEVHKGWPRYCKELRKQSNCIFYEKKE